MKLKNINAFEKHVDKAVIAVAVLFMLFVVWAYVVSDRFPAAQTIDDEVLSIAERLEERLNDPAPEELTGFQVPEYADQFVATINEPLTPVSPVEDIDANRLALPALAGFGVMIDDVQGPTGQPRYRPLDIQAPVELAVRSELVTLDPTQEQAVLEAVGGQAPYDTPLVSVAARLDMQSIVDQLQRRPADLNVNPVPEQWLRETFTILDVQIERRHQLADGSWSQPTLIDPMPGRATFRGQFDEVTRQNAMSYINAIRERQGGIIRPEGYLLMNNVWQPPMLTDPVADTEEGEAAVDPDNPNAQRIRQLQMRQRQISTRLDQLQRRQPSPAVTREIAERQQELAVIRRQLQQLGADVPAPQQPRRVPGGFDQPDPRMMMEERFGPDMVGGPDGMGERRGPAALTGTPLSQDMLDVWTSDLTVEPGRTYQYRLRIITTNPLYGRPLPESQEDLREQFTLAGEWSPWSDPVETHQLRYFWAVSGSEDVGYAKVQLWRFHDGIWKMAEDNVHPGDPIGSPSTPWQPLAGELPAGVAPDGPVNPNNLPPAVPTGPIDFSTGLVVVDIDFAHKLREEVGGIGLNRDTTRLIFTDDGDALRDRLVIADREMLDPMKEKLLGAGAYMTEAEKRRARQEAYQERLRRQREEAEGRQDNRPERDPGMEGPPPGFDEYQEPFGR